ncbi:MAG: adenylosuccinate synthase [Alphaproteobacteria bacterium]|uniref:Adenylosuccinate synthetase n=1 Tax=PS1 clade bacterium TaxID=2175152 RepID=A0A368DRG5_9PROT|nr:adenylosuccinate synthase [Rhodobiaceae bacterium]OUT75391.1 MAG: adenylosuccinate synthase [Rhizobiales bacterium TMED25]RCL73926.1 MAG: adenylosuccinate synthase [PS1 clade bacterium]|tara:strand:- start:55633 stop:56919 length:1287 start_codon:yes stop_codon:yes gene_type:complete
MTSVVIVGTQWGDEGKGKIVDSLSQDADVIVRFQGGHNAGHTLVVDGQTIKLSLLPSGIVRKNKLTIIGNGVVLDPQALISEINYLSKLNIAVTSENLRIAENVTLILPLHKDLDLAREKQAGKSKIGTTGRGIGPAYEDKVARRSIKLIDLEDINKIPEKISRILDHHNILRKAFGLTEICADSIVDYLKDIQSQILPFMDNTWRLLNEMRLKDKKVLFEGAQGLLLDIDFGTYPFVTSSNTLPAQAAIGTGVGPKYLDNIIGITKAYTTRVGSGPFPTELFDEIGEKLGDIGKEFGTVTGRERRCGWFDAVLVRQTIQISGIDMIALTKLDVLDTFDKIMICIGYEIDGQQIDYFPFSENMQSKVKPIYEEHNGWLADTSGVNDINDLPYNALQYIKKIEEFIGIPIKIISTSPKREDIIFLENIF